MAKKTHEEYISELKIKNPMVEAIGTYISSKTKIKHHCLIHDVYWDAQPSNVLSGSGCPTCRKERIGKNLSKTHDQYVLEVRTVNPNISVIGKYIGANTSILHRCLIDGYEWSYRPANILSGYGCPKCSERFRRTHDYYVSELAEVNPMVKVIDQFSGLQVPILHKCTIHNIEWMTTPENALNGHRCYKCGNDAIGDKNRKTHEEYVDNLKLSNPDVMVIGTYVDSFTPILHRCLIDDYEWKTTPANLLSGRGCPRCQESSGERQIRQWLEKHNIDFVFQKTFPDCKDKRVLPFDFYLPNYHIAIEYDGYQHFKPIPFFGGEQSYIDRLKHDKMKDDYCEEKNIKLFRIPYYKNVENELNNFLFI